MHTILDGLNFVRPRCPNCQGRLQFVGKVVEDQGVRKWIDGWSCPIHGQVDTAQPGDEFKQPY